MNHFVLNSDIVATKEQDLLSTRMIKVGNIINASINAHFRSLERFDGYETLFRCIGIFLFFRQLSLAESQLVCIGRHGSTTSIPNNEQLTKK